MGLKSTLNVLFARRNLKLIQDLTQGLDRRYLNDFRIQESQRLATDHGADVKNGMFKGMRLPTGCDIPDSAWSNGDLASMLWGMYELEVQPFLQEILIKEFKCLVNIGCADGYYAVGMKLSHPSAQVIANDIRPDCAAAVTQLASLNEVEVVFSCDNYLEHPDRLPPETDVLIIDCEGGEQALLNWEPSHLEGRSLIIETHDLFAPNVTENLQKHLSKTHLVEVRHQVGRDPYAIEALAHLAAFEKYILLSELRGADLRWIVARPKG